MDLPTKEQYMRSSPYLLAAIVACGLTGLSTPRADAMSAPPAGLRAGLEAVDLIQHVDCRYINGHWVDYINGQVGTGCKPGVVIPEGTGSGNRSGSSGSSDSTTNTTNNTGATTNNTGATTNNTGTGAGGTTTNTGTGAGATTSTSTETGGATYTGAGAGATSTEATTTTGGATTTTGGTGAGATNSTTGGTAGGTGKK